MKKLLIHNNNTFLNQTDYFNIEEQFVFGFNTDNVEIDKIIQKELTTGTLIGKIMQSDVLFIKISLSKNYLEYLGIRLAYHIRLTKELSDKSTIPIVFVAEEDLQFVGITSVIPSLLFTRGIYFMKDNIDGFSTYKNLIEQKKLNGSLDIDLFKMRLQEAITTLDNSNHPLVTFSEPNLLTTTTFSNQVSKHLWEFDNIINAHCYLVNKNSKNIFDWMFNNVGWHTPDWWLNFAVAKTDRKMLCFKEKLTTQFDGFSEIDKMNKNYG